MVRLPALEVGEFGFHLVTGATKQLRRKRKLRSPQWCSDCQGTGKLFEQWHDMSCSKSAKFVCSKKICDNATTTTPSPKNTGTHITSPFFMRYKFALQDSPPVTITLATSAALGLIILAILVSLGLRRKRKTDKKEPSCNEMNPLYGLYCFHDGEKMEDNYVSVTEENSYYG